MGLFAMNMGDKDSSKAWAETAMHNLRLFMQTSEHTGTIYCNSDYPSEYLLILAKGDIDRAIAAYRVECDKNPNINPVDTP